MPTRTFTRKTAPAGQPADPTRGDPSFSSGILTALPGRTWRLRAATDVVVDIDGGDLSAQEDTDLTAAHTAWVTESQTRFAPTFEVTTVQAGRTQKIEWFETDNGDGTYADLARDAVYSWTGSNLTSIVTTDYYDDGTVIPKSVVTETFFTNDANQRIRKVADG
jgi:hypothetical protein